MQEPTSLFELINQLPVDAAIKQELQDKLKTQGEDAVKVEIRAILIQSAELLKQNQQAEELLPEATANYQEELNQIDQQASYLSADISTDMDKHELGQVRQKLS